MTDTHLTPVCGLSCGENAFFGQTSPAFGIVVVSPFTTAGQPRGSCPLQDCSPSPRLLGHSGLCAGFPCQGFLDRRGPHPIAAGFAASLKIRRSTLAERVRPDPQALMVKMAAAHPPASTTRAG